jgi:hypothetical protein
LVLKVVDRSSNGVGKLCCCSLLAPAAAAAAAVAVAIAGCFVFVGSRFPGMLP